MDQIDEQYTEYMEKNYVHNTTAPETRAMIASMKETMNKRYEKSDQNHERTREEIGDLRRQLGEVLIEARGINRRLDITNGRIATSEQKIIELEKADITSKNSVENLFSEFSKVYDRAREAKLEVKKLKESLSAAEKERLTTKQSRVYDLVKSFVIPGVLFIITLVLIRTGVLNVQEQQNDKAAVIELERKLAEIIER